MAMKCFFLKPGFVGEIHKVDEMLIVILKELLKLKFIIKSQTKIYIFK